MMEQSPQFERIPKSSKYCTWFLRGIFGYAIGLVAVLLRDVIILPNGKSII